jgi:hypothetical protein
MWEDALWATISIYAKSGRARRLRGWVGNSGSPLGELAGGGVGEGEGEGGKEFTSSWTAHTHYWTILRLVGYKMGRTTLNYPSAYFLSFPFAMDQAVIVYC